jgi:hypothetical protein
MGIMLGGLSILFKGRQYFTNWDFRMHVQIVFWVLLGCSNMDVVATIVKLLEFFYRIVGISMLLYWVSFILPKFAIFIC